MEKITRRSLLALPILAPFASLTLADARGQEANQVPKLVVGAKTPMLSPREKIKRRYFPDVILTTHKEKQVRFYEDLIKDKVVVINMMYAECEGVCPGITKNLVRVQRLFGDQMGRDIFFYSFTLKPEKDNPEALRHYVKMHKIGPGWLFLTGKPEDMELLRRKLGFTNPNPEVDKDSSQHIGNIRFGNEPQMLWAGCPGQAKPKWIHESISWLMRRPEIRAKTS
jgi:protein SCO1